MYVGHTASTFDVEIDSTHSSGDTLKWRRCTYAEEPDATRCTCDPTPPSVVS